MTIPKNEQGQRQLINTVIFAKNIIETENHRIN